MPLINYDINLILTSTSVIIHSNCFILSTDVSNKGAIFSVADPKLYALIVTYDNTNMLQHLKFSFRLRFRLNIIKINPFFQGENSVFVLSVEDTTH